MASGKSTETAEGESPSGEDAPHPQGDFLEKGARPEIGRNAPPPGNIFHKNQDNTYLLPAAGGKGGGRFAGQYSVSG